MNIGDKVIVIEDKVFSSLIGKTGIIINIIKGDPEKNNIFNVKFSNGTSIWYNIKEIAVI